MIVKKWGVVAYNEAREAMDEVHKCAVADGENYLILCSHPNIFTVGSDSQERFEENVIACDRGGSVTCHSPGQNIFYFCFQVKHPPRFYRKVLSAFESFFQNHLPAVKYDKTRPGFYIENRKIASLGFRYRDGVSLHGVALNVDVDLEFHSKIAPCNLEGIVPTSLHNEGLYLTQEQINASLVEYIVKSFDDAAL